MGLSFNGLTKVITLTTGTTSLSVRQLWSRWVDWFLTSDNSKYLPAFSQVGGNDIDPIVGTAIPIYAFLMNGWKLKPQEANHTVTISDGILLVDGGGDPFNNTDGAYTVRINYQQPVQAITVATGGGVTPPTPEEIATAVWESLLINHTNVNTFGKSLSDMSYETSIITAILKNKMITDPLTGVMTIYAEDGSILLSAQLYEDADGLQKYRGQGSERREELE